MTPARRTDERLASLEQRLERLERLAFLSYVEIRRVADYAYLNILLEQDADTIKRIQGMRALSDHEALRSGMDVQDLVHLKVRMTKFLQARCRHDVLELAQDLAKEREMAASERNVA